MQLAMCWSRGRSSRVAPASRSARETAAAKAGVFIFLRTLLGSRPSRRVGRTQAQAITKPHISSTANNALRSKLSLG